MISHILDADIEVLAPLDRGATLAGTHGGVITPHMIGLRADFEPWFLRSGTYNAGIVAVFPSGRPFVESALASISAPGAARYRSGSALASDRRRPGVRELSGRYADRLLAAAYDEPAERESRLHR